MITLYPDRPVVIAGPTGAGKSALALHIAENQGGVIVNADALQVFDGWRIITARPSDADLARAPHALYGHVPFDAPYSVGHWLRDVGPLLGGARPIIVGGTGLYLTALTEGLADIPATPDDIRQTANGLTPAQMISALDSQTLSRIDTQNPVRVQRAWEVQQSTGRSLADWQDNTPPAVLPRDQTHALVLDAPKDWLTPRIARRFDQMLDAGVLDEAAAMHPHWNPAHLSAKAIGAPELIAHLRGEMTLDEVRTAVVVASTQYAKRQRTWFRKRMAKWETIPMISTELSTTFQFYA